MDFEVLKRVLAALEARGVVRSRFTWELARRTNLRRFTPGVFRYRSIAEMNGADEDRLAEHLRARR